MKTKILFFLLLFSCIISTYAQNTIPLEYTYDNAGNRICRKVIDLDNLMQMRSKGRIVDTSYLVDNLQSIKINVSPNPTYGIINVTMDNIQINKDISIRIFDSMGHLLDRQNKSGNSFYVDLAAYPSGFYLVDIVAGDERTTWKIVKQ
ncbi:MAG: T9SS type A sorting domain-containing protein [Bacteroidales bacterium]|nr:T9SS type A sorting domain-containing protein [Bacteroidales bacterium]